MTGERHSIRQQTFDIEVDSEAVALALQPYIGDINRRRFVPVIERVIEEFAAPGEHVRIARLDLDLGELPAGNFEQAAEQALEVALRRALEEAVRNARGDPASAHRIRSAAASRLELIDHYLARGTLPFWADAEDFSPERLMSQIAESDPAALVSTLRRHARDRRVLERIALQLSPAALEALLRLLDPEHAALILAYMVDLRQIHHVAPLLAVGEPAFGRLLWVLVLSYVLRDAGSQFNRKSFVRSLLEGMAEREGLSYGDIVETLRRGLQATQRHHSLASSLPAVISELAGDDAAGQPADDAISAEPASGRMAAGSQEEGAPGDPGSRLELLARLLTGRMSAFGQATAGVAIEPLVQALLEADPGGLAALLRRHGRHEAVLVRLVEQTSDPVLQRVLAVIEAEHAALIIGYMVALRRAHRSDRLLRLTGELFRRLLWILALSHLLRDPGTQFNRKSFVRSLLVGIAERESVDYLDLVGVLRAGLRQTEARHAPTSLLAIIEELADELVSARTDATAGTADASPQAVLAWLERYLASGEVPRGLPEAIGSDAQALFQLAVGRDPAGTADLIRRLVWSDTRRAALLDRLSGDIPVREAAALMEPRRWAAIERRLRSGDQAAARDGAVAPRASWAAALDAIVDPSARHGATAPADRFDQADEPIQSLDAHPTPASDAVARHEPWIGPTPDAAFEPAAFEPYDTIASVHHYLLHGVLPWDALLRDPGLTVARALASLTGLSPPQLRRVFAADPVRRSRLVARAVTELPEDDVVAMLARLLPPAQSDELRSALADFAAQASDRSAFYAHVLTALLEQAPIDLEQAAAEALDREPQQAVSGGAETRDASVLASLVASRLRFDPRDRPGTSTAAEVLRALVAHHPDESAHVLAGVAEAPDLRDALLRQIPPDALQSILDRIRPGETAAVQAVLAALAPLPAAVGRVTDAERLDLLVQAVFRLTHGPAVDVFTWLLRHLYGTPVPPEVGPMLRRAAAAWRTSGVLPAAHVTTLEAALTRLDLGSAEKAVATPSPAAGATDPSRRVQEAVFAWLRRGDADPAGGPERDERGAAMSDASLAHALERLIADEAAPVAAFVREQAADGATRDRWADALPESTLARLAYLLAPGRYRVFLPIVEILVAAWRETAPAGQNPAGDRAFMWGFLLEMLSVHGDALSPDRLVGAFFARTAAADARLAAQLAERAGRLAQSAGNTGLFDILRRDRAALLTAPDSVGAPPAVRPHTGGPAELARRDAPTPRRGRTAFSLGGDEEEGGGEPIYVPNAGLVLTAPFLPHLFQTLGFLGQDEGGRQRLRDHDTVSRAVHLLQYLVDGRTGAPEPLLVLNKILCGAPTQAPVARTIEPTEAEQALCDRLLRAMIANWTIIEHTSVTGLRETFLQREGKLQRVDDGWKLRIQRKTVDVLVDQVPWSISVILQAWMREPIHVTW